MPNLAPEAVECQRLLRRMMVQLYVFTAVAAIAPVTMIVLAVRS